MNGPGNSAVPTGFANEVVISETTFRALRHAQPSQRAGQKRKREVKDVLDGKGSKVYKSPWAKYEASIPSESESEYEEVTDNGTEDESGGQEHGEEEQPLQPMATDYIPDNIGERTEFLGSEERDYLGRTYMHVPTDLNINLSADLSEDYRSYVPKKVIHTWKQQKGSATTALRFFPNTGHLLLSASGDGTVRLYDVYRNKREILRSYIGHNKLCNDICFSPDGTEFLSSSLDRKIKLWDTETGICKNVLNMKGTPHVVKINPSHPSEFLAGVGNLIVQQDLRSGEVVQEYDYHLGPVNTITFCDENRRFVSTSDDRSVRAWEYSIAVPIKYISEPDMFPLNRSAAHPRKPFIAFQSTDNQIVVYSSSDKFRQNRKKGFRGHNNAGYAIDLAFSPDGEYLMGGDSGGYVCWWSWKTCRLMHKEVASERPVISCDWHPKETSKCVTGDTEGIIKFWD